MNRRDLILASLPVAALGFVLPASAQRRRPTRRTQASRATSPARRRRVPSGRGGLTANHVRTRIITRTFTSTGPLTIPGTGTLAGPASPYPSTIQVGGFNRGQIQKVRVSLIGLTHAYPQDLDVLLMAPGNVGVMLMSDTGSGISVTNTTLIFDQDAAGTLPTPLVSGVFQPSNFFEAPDPLPAPAPAGVTSHSLTRLNTRNPNGAWHLFVVDDQSSSTGNLAGWSLTIQARVRVPHRHRRQTPQPARRRVQ